MIHPERYDAFVPFSFEAEEDSAQLEEQLRMAMADARAVLEAAGWISGAGHSASPPQPLGLVTALDGSASEVAPTTAEAFGKDDIPKLLKAVPARFRSNTSVIMDYATYLTARDFTPPGSTTDAPLFNDDETRVLGKAWFEATAMRSTDDINAAATADNHVVIAGDFQRGYTIVDRIGVRFELVPHLLGSNRRPTGERGLFMYGRTSGGVVNLNALRSLNVATTA